MIAINTLMNGITTKHFQDIAVLFISLSIYIYIAVYQLSLKMLRLKTPYPHACPIINLQYPFNSLICGFQLTHATRIPDICCANQPQRCRSGYIMALGSIMHLSLT